MEGDEGLKTFTYEELYAATDGWSEDQLLGEGGFGHVYKAYLPDWWGSPPRNGSSHGAAVPLRVCAVKKLRSDSFQGYKEWLAEIMVLGRMRHPNVVHLLGYCATETTGLLVYDFLANGSLDYHLFGDLGIGPLPWAIRVKIALDAARGLEYLHHNNVIHRDVKASNILLDEHYGGRLTDFGMARAGPMGEKTHITTRIMGSKGYVDPRYMVTGHLTTKSDVYAFGVVLLELLTGQRAAGHSESGQNLALWAKPVLAQRKPDIEVLVDPALKGDFDLRTAHKLVIIIRTCIQDEPTRRPTMSDIVMAITYLGHGSSP